MEAYQHTQNHDVVSNKANWSQIDKFSEVGSETDDQVLDMNMSKQGTPKVVLQESNEGGGQELDNSLDLLKQMLNPFSSFARYLSRNGYIGKIEQQNPNSVNSKLLACAEEFSQNFYYAFIAKAVLSLGQGLVNPRSKLYPVIRHLLSTKNLALCAYMAVLGSGYKFAMEKLRTMSASHDKISALISIGLTAYSLLINKGKMKKNYMFLFLF